MATDDLKYSEETFPADRTPVSAGKFVDDRGCFGRLNNTPHHTAAMSEHIPAHFSPHVQKGCKEKGGSMIEKHVLSMHQAIWITIPASISAPQLICQGRSKRAFTSLPISRPLSLGNEKETVKGKTFLPLELQKSMAERLRLQLPSQSRTTREPSPDSIARPAQRRGNYSRG